MPTIEETRRVLAAKLRDTIERNERVAQRLRHASQLPDDWIDRAPLLADEEVLAELDDGARAEVAALRAALARLEDGSYGTCAECGEPISAGRLAALPTARTCVDCAS